MLDYESRIHKSVAVVINPETNEPLGQISMVGDPVLTTKWIQANGPLQGFIIVDGRKHLKEVWAYQEEVLLRTSNGQRFIKIVTYPTDGENQGYLDFTSDLEKSPRLPSERNTRILTQRGLAFLQSLFSI